MNVRSFFTLVTAVTAVLALAGGMLLAIHAPAPSAGEFGQTLFSVDAEAEAA